MNIQFKQVHITNNEFLCVSRNIGTTTSNVISAFYDQLYFTDFVLVSWQKVASYATYLEFLT